MKKISMAWFPVLLRKKALALLEDKIVFNESEKSKEVLFEDIKKIVVQPKAWTVFLLKTYDLKIVKKDSTEFFVLNLTKNSYIYLKNEIMKKSESIGFEENKVVTGILVSGLIRTSDF